MSHYLRTCTACGRQWTVTPAGAHEGRLGRLLARLRRADPETAAGAHSDERAYAGRADPRDPMPAHTPGSAREALRHCPRCEGTTFTEERRPGPAE